MIGRGFSQAVHESRLIRPSGKSRSPTHFRILFANQLDGSVISLTIVIVSSLAFLTSISFRQASIRMALKARRAESRARTRERKSIDHLVRGFARIGLERGERVLSALRSERLKFSQTTTLAAESGLHLAEEIPALATKTFRQGIKLLLITLGMAELVDTTDAEMLRNEQRELEASLGRIKGDDDCSELSEIIKAKIASRTERIDNIKEQSLRLEKLLLHCDRCIASIQRTRIRIASLSSDALTAGMSDESRALELAIAEAKEVQEELSKLGF